MTSIPNILNVAAIVFVGLLILYVIFLTPVFDFLVVVIFICTLPFFLVAAFILKIAEIFILKRKSL